MKTCDLHMHSTYSDGDLSVRDLLIEAEQKKLKVISITDHDEIKQFEEIEKLKKENLFSGKIIPGSEICALCNGAPIEILAYNFDYNKFLPYLKKLKEKSDKRWETFIKKIHENFLKIDPKYDEIELTKEELDKVYKKQKYGLKKRDPLFDIYIKAQKSSKIMHKMKKENPMFAKKFHDFFRGAIANPNSLFYCSLYEVLPSGKTVTELVHKCGGITSLAHPMEYEGNTKMILDNIVNDVDGIECYHPTAKENFKKLIKFAKANKKLITGGSDYHGFKNKMGQMNVPYKIYSKIERKTKKG